MIALAQEVERARAGDAALTRRVLEALGWHQDACGCPTAGLGGRGEPGLWRRPDGDYHFGPLPPVTEDVAAAHTLLAATALTVEVRGRGWRVVLPDGTSTEAATLPLALCAAAVKASGPGTPGALPGART